MLINLGSQNFSNAQVLSQLISSSSSHSHGIRQHLFNGLSWISWEHHKLLLALSWPIDTVPKENTFFYQ
jgi:hypothetical protein